MGLDDVPEESRPAAEGIAPGHFPGPPVAAGHVTPCPRRIRARDAGGWFLDTVAAFYVWEHPFYPQYAVPALGLPPALRERAIPAPPDPRLDGYVVVHLDDGEDGGEGDGASGASWFEEDERVLGHPRNPYVRVDAVRSRRTVRVALSGADGGCELAHTTAPVGVFETGLPPRWYLDPTCVDWSNLTPSEKRTRCPYKGVTSHYWNAGDLADVAWSYSSPNAGLGAIAGLVCFDDTIVEVRVDPTGND